MVWLGFMVMVGCYGILGLVAGGLLGVYCGLCYYDLLILII
jgi:hypothetical protein